MNADDSNEHLFHVGSTIAGRYLVERPIGEGAMGAVALARHVSLDETVAIKFLRPELRRDPVANARLSREAKALARIKSDHVARVLDVGATLSVGPYMVMEYLEGTDLGEVLESEGPLPVARAVECVLQVCEALTVAHTAGITHRDIKPQNLFLARHGQFETLKVLDFGIADVAPSPSGMPADPLPEPSPTASGERPVAPVYGTPPYMAPERVRNDPSADHRSDIWSVGVVMHELVTGRGVFDAPTITETCSRIVSDAPIDIETSEAVLPASLRTIIARCLMRNPAERYQSVEELAAALAPLATMHERFRGRSTGAFSRRLREEQRALQAQNGSSSRSASHGRAPGVAPSATRGAVAADTASGGAGFDGVLEALRGWVVHARPSAWLRARGLGDRAAVKYVSLAAASLLVAAVAVSVAGGVRWMTPPPASSVPVRAEVTPQVEHVPRAVVERVQSLVAEPSEEAASPAAAPSSVGEANAGETPPVLPSPSRAAAASSPARERHTSPKPSRSPAADADAEDGARSGEARSRVRLVKERLVTNQPTRRADAADGSSAAAPGGKAEAEAARKDRAKKARPLPTWLQPFQPKKQDGKAPVD